MKERPNAGLPGATRVERSRDGEPQPPQRGAGGRINSSGTGRRAEVGEGAGEPAIAWHAGQTRPEGRVPRCWPSQAARVVGARPGVQERQRTPPVAEDLVALTAGKRKARERSKRSAAQLPAFRVAGRRCRRFSSPPVGGGGGGINSSGRDRPLRCAVRGRIAAKRYRDVPPARSVEGRREWTGSGVGWPAMARVGALDARQRRTGLPFSSRGARSRTNSSSRGNHPEIPDSTNLPVSWGDERQQPRRSSRGRSSRNSSRATVEIATRDRRRMAP